MVITASDRSSLIRLASAMPKGSEERKFLLQRLASGRRAEVSPEVVLDQMIDNWTEGFLSILGKFEITEEDVNAALSKDVGAEDVNSLFETQMKTAGLTDTVRALGGKVFSGAWHMITGPLIAIRKLFTQPSYRKEVALAVKRAIKHEARATKHMAIVAAKLATGEEVKPQEVRTAAIQFVDVLTKVLLVYFVGPHIAHLFSHGVLKALVALLSPLDEVIAVLLDKPLRMASEKFLGASIGLLPSGFYTHF